MRTKRTDTFRGRLIAYVSFFSVSLFASSLSAATLTVEFKADEGKPAEYEEVNIYVLNMGTARSLDDALRHTTDEKTFSKAFENLVPGKYVVLSFTGSLDQIEDASRPGAFRSQDQVDLVGNDANEKVTIHYEVLDTRSRIGEEKATGRVLDTQDRPVIGVEISAVAMIETAGRLVIAKVRTDEDGVFQFSNLAAGQRYALIDSSGSMVGQISAGGDVTVQIPPQVGDAAPDFSFIHLASGETKRLSDFKGKVVMVDFWASWCGPCQEPMEQLQAYREKYPDWGDRVELIALSIDDARKSAVDHLKKNGWTKSYNAWAGEGGFRSEASKAYAISGIPAAYIINQEGKISATGHPMALDIPTLINSLLAGSE